MWIYERLIRQRLANTVSRTLVDILQYIQLMTWQLSLSEKVILLKCIHVEM